MKGGSYLELTRYHYNLWLILVFGAANPKIHQITKKYGSAQKAFEAITAGDTSTLNEPEKQKLRTMTVDYINRILDYCSRREISLCTMDDEEYPELLKEIYDPPVLLFYRGDLKCLRKLSLTFVGARNIKPYITRLCSRITRDIASREITIVSGMARGVDECAHTACAVNGYKTVAVLACGIDVEYPYNSAALKQQITDAGGAYISELLPNAGVSRDYFNPRNRILAGLSRGTVVFQASMKSGSLITASHAVDENRDVFCVPPPDVFDPEYIGVIKYLRDGAIPVFNHDDILDQYKGLYI